MLISYTAEQTFNHQYLGVLRSKAALCRYTRILHSNPHVDSGQVHAHADQPPVAAAVLHLVLHMHTALLHIQDSVLHLFLPLPVLVVVDILLHHIQMVSKIEGKMPVESGKEITFLQYVETFLEKELLMFIVFGLMLLNLSRRDNITKYIQGVSRRAFAVYV